MRVELGLMLLGGALLPATAAAADPLAALKWKARPIVVLADSRDDPRVSRQIEAFDARKDGVSERDIAVLTETSPNGPLHRRFGVAERGFAVVLVGKDGGVKEVWRDPVDPRRIFSVIDAMPMRRDEMKG